MYPVPPKMYPRGAKSMVQTASNEVKKTHRDFRKWRLQKCPDSVEAEAVERALWQLAFNYVPPEYEKAAYSVVLNRIRELEAALVRNQSEG